MKNQIKAILHAIAPHKFDALMTARSNRHGQEVMAQAGVPAIAEAFVQKYGAVVQAGPFAGMQYITESIGSSFLPKLVGSYESELLGVFTKIFDTPYDTVVDVGSAEGYYVVALAMRLTHPAKIYAFDIDTHAQALCQTLAEKNGVADKITIGGFCDPAALQNTLHGRCLVICDCEGYETEVLQPALAPVLTTSDILVELHDILKPGITPIILERFSESHDIQLIDTCQRRPEEYPSVSFLSPEQQRVAVSEFRNGPQQWAWMTAKSL